MTANSGPRVQPTGPLGWQGSGVRRCLWIASSLLWASITTAFIVRPGALGLVDSMIYMGAANMIWAGESVYDFSAANGFGFTYPPFAALIFSLISWLPAGIPVLLMRVLGVAATYGVAWVALGQRVASKKQRELLTLFVGGALLFWYPVFRIYSQGQVDLGLFMLAAVDILLLRKARWSGVLVGLAAGFKLTPAAFLLVFIVRRDWRGLLVGVASGCATILLGFLILPGDSARYWTDLIFRTDRVGSQAAALNQSLAAVVARLQDATSDSVAGSGAVIWLAAVAATTIWGLIVMHKLDARADDLSVLAANLLVMLLISPVAWLHHWASALVVVIVLMTGSVAGRPILPKIWGGLGLVVAAIPPWWYLGGYREDGSWGLGKSLLGSALVFWAVGTLVMLWFLKATCGNRISRTPKS